MTGTSNRIVNSRAKRTSGRHGICLVGILLVIGGLSGCDQQTEAVSDKASASRQTTAADQPADSDNARDGGQVAGAVEQDDSQAARQVKPADPRFTDPAPPKVNKLAKSDPLPPLAYKRVTFHGKPKPLPAGAVTHDWPCFLGPTRSTISSETKLLKKWPKSGPKLVWELQTGDGYASPSIQGDRLIYPHRVEDEVIVECLHPANGKKYWGFRFPTKYRDRYGYSNGPRASPVIDGNRVYIYSAEGKLFCLKLQTGQVYWKRNLTEEFKVTQDFFGSVATPLIEGNLLILNVGATRGPCVAAFDKITGKLVWGAGDKWGPSYATAMPATIHGRRRVLVFAGGDSDPPTGGLLSLDPANGAIDFEFPWRSKKYESVNASCPLVIGNQVFISASYGAGSALLEIEKDFSHTTVWTMKDNEHNKQDNELGLHWNTPVHKDGHLYAFDGRNEPDASLACVNLKTGKVVWREEPEWEETVTLNGQQQDLGVSTLRGSLLWVDGHFLCLGELGHLLWLDLTPKGYKEMQRTWLFAAQHSWAPPIVSRGLLYVSQNGREIFKRTPPRLLCYDLRAESK